MPLDVIFWEGHGFTYVIPVKLHNIKVIVKKSKKKEHIEKFVKWLSFSSQVSTSWKIKNKEDKEGILSITPVTWLCTKRKKYYKDLGQLK